MGSATPLVTNVAEAAVVIELCWATDRVGALRFGDANVNASVGMLDDDLSSAAHIVVLRTTGQSWLCTPSHRRARTTIPAAPEETS